MLAGVEVSDVLEIIGHDGSASVPGNPFGRRCFYEIDIIPAAYRMGIILVPMVRYLQINEERRETIIEDQTFKRMLERHSGILCGEWRGRGIGHAVAWNHDSLSVFEPREPEVMSMEHLNERFNVEVFLAWINTPVLSNISS